MEKVVIKVSKEKRALWKERAEERKTKEQFSAKTIVTVRPNGRPRIQKCFKNSPSMTEQHTGHTTDINYLVKKYTPDELAAYIAARNQYRQEVKGHDFSIEPSLQEGKNAILVMKEEWAKLPSKIKKEFNNDMVAFLKFLDNPSNKDKMIELGILKEKQIDKLTGDELLKKKAANKAEAERSDKENADKAKE